MITYTEEQLIAFGNYLLSDERKKMVKEDNRNMVHHADIENYNIIRSQIVEIIETSHTYYNDRQLQIVLVTFLYKDEKHTMSKRYDINEEIDFNQIVEEIIESTIENSF